MGYSAGLRTVLARTTPFIDKPQMYGCTQNVHNRPFYRRNCMDPGVVGGGQGVHGWPGYPVPLRYPSGSCTPWVHRHSGLFRHVATVAPACVRPLSRPAHASPIGVQRDMRSANMRSVGGRCAMCEHAGADRTVGRHRWLPSWRGLARHQQQ